MGRITEYSCDRCNLTESVTGRPTLEFSRVASVEVAYDLCASCLKDWTTWKAERDAEYAVTLQAFMDREA